MVEIRPLDAASLARLEELFGTDKSAAGCWCMWFIVPVTAYHAAGGDGNRASFREMAAAQDIPMGLIAYLDDGRPTGWCAVGPRSRYARAIRTPTYKGRDPAEDADVWLLPCLFVRPDQRGAGVSAKLVRAAVDLAARHGASAVEAFPLSGERRYSRDTQVGFEPVFAQCGFAAIATPSPGRVRMRLDLSVSAAP